jgi:hypothetical protein
VSPSLSSISLASVFLFNYFNKQQEPVRVFLSTIDATVADVELKRKPLLLQEQGPVTIESLNPFYNAEYVCFPLSPSLSLSLPLYPSLSLSIPLYPSIPHTLEDAGGGVTFLIPSFFKAASISAAISFASPSCCIVYM